MERLRSESDENTDGHKHIRDKTDIITANSQRESAWGALVDWSGEKKREEIIEDLKAFQKATGINETKHIQDLVNAKSNKEIYEKESKMKKASSKWYEIQLKKSGLYEPIDDREGRVIGKELKEIVDWFSSLDFSGDFSMVSTLCRMKQDFEPRRKFREKLKNQSTFVKNEYFRRLGSISLLSGNKEQLFANILAEIKEVENSPSAVQFEFKKKQKTTKENKDTSKLKKEVLKGFETRKSKYLAQVLANKEYFGGETKKTPLGELPETAWEFIQWFEDRNSFASMDNALKKLPSLIKQRKNLYQKRDVILQHALPKERHRIEKQTNKMRRHELESFIPKLKEEVRKNSTHVAEYMATITAARTYHVSLFPSFEKTRNIQRFRLEDVETQAARLKILKSEIAERDRVVREYFDLPTYVRNDQRFILASALEREKLLLDTKEELNREQDSPFEMAEGKTMEVDDLHNIADAMKSHEGETVYKDLKKEIEQEGLMKAAKVQNETYWKIFGAAKNAELHNESQKEHYLRDLKFWTRLDQNVKSEEDAKTDRQKSKWKFIETAEEAFDLGYTLTSGGEVGELQEISETNLKSGSGDLKEKLNMAKYGEHVVLNKADGSMAEDPLKIIERLSEQEMMKVVMLAINKLGQKHMGLSGADTAMLRNSKNIQKEIGDKFISEEFSHMKKAA